MAMSSLPIEVANKARKLIEKTKNGKVVSGMAVSENEWTSQRGGDSALTNPICIEMYGAEQTAMVEFNNRLAQQAQGLLPGFKDDEVYMCKYASLAGSHTNAGLRCINAGLSHPIQDSKIVHNEGRFDLSRVQQVDSGLHQACVNGLRWTVVNDAEVAKIVANLRLVYVVEVSFG